mmetsp:Transcript_22878/g.66066  ORF Transcript_22878/g.66066 Transcript_22878/m.66066 type:complete len:245 (-) Transcript_22878:749-1483(-)
MRSHDGTPGFDVLHRRRRELPLLVVHIQAADRGAILLLVKRPPAHQALQLPVRLLLRLDLENIVVFVQLQLGVGAADKAPSQVMSCHEGVGAVAAVLVGPVGHVEEVAVQADEQPLGVGVLCGVGVVCGQLLRRERSDGLPEVFREPHIPRPGHGPVSACDLQPIDGLVCVLLHVRLRFRLQRGELLPVEAQEHFLFQGALALRDLRVEPGVRSIHLVHLLRGQVLLHALFHLLELALESLVVL